MQTLLTLFLCLLFSIGYAQDAGALAEKFRAAADYRTVKADFLQTRFLKELEMKVEIRGEMVSEKNGRLRWQVDSPFRSVTLIGPQKLEHYDAGTGKTSVISASQLPPGVAILRDCLSEWISGDPDRMGKRFDLAEKDDHTLRLVPKDAGLKQFFLSVEITAGKDFATVERIRIEELSGDLLEIRFLNIVKDPPLTAEIWKIPGK